MNKISSQILLTRWSLIRAEGDEIIQLIMNEIALGEIFPYKEHVSFNCLHIILYMDMPVYF